MYAEIILSRRFPKYMGVFDYQIPERLAKTMKVGYLVSIPFRKTLIEGVVIRLKQTAIAGKKIKEVADIIQEDPILTNEQIILAEWLSRYYFVSTGTVIKMMLPAIPKRKLKTVVYDIGSSWQPDLAPELKDFLKKVTDADDKNFLFWPASGEQYTQMLYWCIKKIAGTILLICPKINDIYRYSNMLPARVKGKTAIFHSQLSNNEFYYNYNQTLTGQVKLIIGTKLALFAPVKNPDLIILDQEENQNHKQADQNPRFDARLVAEQLSEIYQCKLLKLSCAPTVSTFEQYKKKGVITCHPKNQGKTVEIINLKNERKKGNYQQLSEDLIEAVNQNLKNRKKIFLFINKKGSSSTVLCRDCGEVLKCSDCQLPFAFHQHENFLFCHSCNRKADLPPFCKKCSGIIFKFIGSGTQKVEHEVKKCWPDKKIFRLDKDTEKINIPNNFEIIIGTEMAFDILDWETISLAGIISADSFLYLPDFMAAEKTWQMLSKIKYLCQGRIILQTYNPDHLAINSLNDGRYDKFYERELHERLEYHYPPFCRLIKFTYKNADKQACLNEVKQTYNKLRVIIKDISIITPLKPYTGGKWQMYLVVKFFHDFEKTGLRSLIAKIPNDWQIDRDPISLL
ncbi:MAG: primosomal protein N' [Patescibacteria group bacterium]|jgi:primosomal protein N' (replication factor Y)